MYVKAWEQCLVFYTAAYHNQVFNKTDIYTNSKNVRHFYNNVYIYNI